MIVHHLAVLFVALLVDRWVGDPDWLWRRLPHPVAGFGAIVSALDRLSNRDGDDAATRRRNGWAAIALLVLFALVAGGVLAWLFDLAGYVGTGLEIVVVAVFLAQKSLADHVGRVAAALRTEGLAGGRRAVAMIVGRDPEMLDESGVSRAAIESLAENFADGIVAPALWYALLGLPGLLAYKAINTADSMIGHKTARHLDFGRGAALTDDAVNWPAARLSALLVSLAALRRGGLDAGRRSMETALKDAGLHRSPNAGWPESAFAGALGLALAGPRHYGGVAVREAMINAAGRRDAGVLDIARAIALFWRACTVLAGVVAILALAGLAL